MQRPSEKVYLHMEYFVMSSASQRGVDGTATAAASWAAMAPTGSKNAASLPARNEWFDAFARRAATWCGKPVVFIAAVLIVVVWAATGPMFGYGDTWQLVINTG